MNSAPTASLPSFLDLHPENYTLSAPHASDIRLLDQALGTVLSEQDGDTLVRLARQLCREADDFAGSGSSLFDRFPELQNPDVVQKLLRAFTILFQLLNTTEQKEIVRVNRERQAQAGDTTPRPESIREAVQRLVRSGVTADQMQEILQRLNICPTLTAHPTEARRRAVLHKLQRVAEILVERAQPPGLPRLDAPIDTAGRGEAQLLTTLTALWQTDELRAAPITVDDEVRNALYFLEHTIFPVVAWLQDDLKAALADSYPGREFTIPPPVTYRSWVGGDRDGNPYVTPAVTWQTLVRHKRLALQLYQRRIGVLRRELTLSDRLVTPGATLRHSIQTDCDLIPISSEIKARYQHEPYALKLVCIEERLNHTLRHLDALADWDGSGLVQPAQPPAYVNAAQFLADLELLQQDLRGNHARSLADSGPLPHLILQAQTFGFHLAALDIRQHSDVHARALDSIFAAAETLPPEVRYTDLSEDDKLTLLVREIRNPRPLLGRGMEYSDAARQALEVFEIVRQARQLIAAPGVETYIISMTHGASDLLEPMLLAKEVGLLRWRHDEKTGARTLESDLDFVPLFETIDDLRGCDALMKKLFDDPFYQQQLAARNHFQEIMLGYSDSSKDGGYLAANWALQNTQARLAKTCRDANVTLRFFHGRGGTVGRGGGRASRAILSQPPGSFSGQIRFTEQGEVISFRYSLPPIAHRHLEQITSAALLASFYCADTEIAGCADSADAVAPPVPEHFLAAMATIAEQGRLAYRDLVYNDPDFWRFYTEATPIQHISRLPIASRPVSRQGKQLVSVEELRAIPWVFAWVQTRYVLTGWYGVGTALEQFAAEQPDNPALLRQMYLDWPFFKTVIDNVQLELLRAHLATAAWYAARVEPQSLGTRIHQQITAEYARTRDWVLRIIEQDALLAHAPVLRGTIALRNPLVAPISLLQVALMDRLAGEGAEPAWHDAMLLSITGIAAAMQSTG